MNYRGIVRQTGHHPYYVWEEPLSKWEDDEFEDERAARSIEYWVNKRTQVDEHENNPGK